MIDDKLEEWAVAHRLSLSTCPSREGTDVVEVEGVGKFLYIHPVDETVIDDQFGLVLSDDELDAVEDGEVDYILFEFGGDFYYSTLNEDIDRYGNKMYKPTFSDFRYLGKTTEPEVVPLTHLGVHSEYEMMNGSGSGSLWVRKARFMGVRSLGICDRDTLGGVLSFQTACDAGGIKPVIGETVTVAVNYDKSRKNQETYLLKLYVRTDEGWKNLLLINKAINVDYDGFIPYEELLTRGGGLTCVIPKESEFNECILNGMRGDALRLITEYRNAFTGGLYYQIDTVRYSSKEVFLRHLRTLDAYLSDGYMDKVKPVLINDSYYLDKDEARLKIMLNKVSGRIEAEADNQYFKSVEDTLESYGEWLEDVEPLYNVIMEGLENANKIADGTEFRMSYEERKLPKFDTEDADGLFFRELERGIAERLRGKTDKEMEEYLKRLETECNLIVPNGLADYFLIIWDVMRWCRERGILTGVGRGSVCGSLVAYLLYITDVDPLKYGTLFERFLNETRVSGERAKSSDSLPDVDVDFPVENRDEVKDYIRKKYGEEHTCSVGTYNRMQLKTCIKDFGKIKGLSFDYTNKITKDIDDQTEYTWGYLFECATKSKRLFKFVQEHHDIVILTKYALMQPKAESVHPSAVVIVPGTWEGRAIDIYGWIPVKKVDGMLVSEWEGKYIDKAGFLKEDVLGLSQLDKFTMILSLIKQNTGREVVLNDIPFDDKEVYKYFQRGYTEDVFQFGTKGFMTYCKQVRPDCFDDLVTMTSLFRPGPLDVGAHQDFADIKAGKKKPKYDYGMEEITRNTFGLYAYQEQVMKAVVVGGLSLVESDLLRTAIKKKKKDVMKSFEDKFKDGYVRLLSGNGIERPEEYTARVWDKMMAFSTYAYNKSHAVAYSITSYWSEWLKVNYPLEFWTTSLNYAKEAEVPYRLAEMKKTGVEVTVRPPDVNFSDLTFTCDASESRIFFSLTKIKGVGEVAVTNILKVRKEGGRFFNLEEFISRVPKSKVNSKVVRLMIAAGAFDLIEGIDTPKGRKDLMSHYVVDLLGGTMPTEYDTEEAGTDAFWTMEQKRLTGFGEIDYEMMLRDAIPSKRMLRMYVTDTGFMDSPIGTEVTVAGRLISYKETDIRSGRMCTVQLNCNNVVIEVVLWPDAYKRIGVEVETLKGVVVAVSGTIERDKFRNERKVYSNALTKFYIVQERRNGNG